MQLACGFQIREEGYYVVVIRYMSFVGEVLNCIVNEEHVNEWNVVEDNK